MSMKAMIIKGTTILFENVFKITTWENSSTATKRIFDIQIYPDSSRDSHNFRFETEEERTHYLERINGYLSSFICPEYEFPKEIKRKDIGDPTDLSNFPKVEV